MPLTHGFRNQLDRAALSVSNNIAEGFERGGRAEFHQLLSVAKASRGEVRSQLYVAVDVGHLDQATFTNMFGLVEEVGRIIGGLRVSVAAMRK